MILATLIVEFQKKWKLVNVQMGGVKSSHEKCQVQKQVKRDLSCLPVTDPTRPDPWIPVRYG